MIQEEKELLLKDLCARLPYKVKVRIKHEKHGDLTGILYAVYPDEKRVIVDELSKAIAMYNVRCGGFVFDECIIKPYLRPMSSMTEEEENEYRAINCYEGLFPCNENALDYVLSHHFDYRGLIEKGLALEAPEEMYSSR